MVVAYKSLFSLAENICFRPQQKQSIHQGSCSLVSDIRRCHERHPIVRGEFLGFMVYIITDNGKPFSNHLMDKLCEDFVSRNTTLQCTMPRPTVSLKHSTKLFATC
ncbi:unnamed protein product [Prunus armeniaca]